MARLVNRRRFLEGLAAGAAGVTVLRDSRSAFSYAANDRLNIGLVGCGGRGSWFVDAIPPLANLAALCDVNEQRAAEAFKKHPALPRYHDFRKMLDQKGIEAVICAAPDHIHAVCSLAAMRAGKHIFCEKPLTHTLHEARVLRQAAAKSRVATQMGNQGTSSEAFRRAVELVQAGVLGEVREVLAWNEGGGAGKKQVPRGEQPVPAHLQWDLWLGPMPYRPFHPEWLQWHAWRDFGTGQLGNWASHTMNLPFKSLRLESLWDEPPAGAEQPTVKVSALVEEVNRASFPRWEIITYEFPARGSLPPVKITWSNGHQLPGGHRAKIEGVLGRRLDWGDAGQKKWNDYAGCLLIGDKGVLHSTGHNMSFSLLPEGMEGAGKDVPRTLPRTPSHEREWLDACRGGRQAMSNFEYAGRLAEFVLLGNVATQIPEGVAFHPPALKFVSNPKADALIRQDYRPGWSL